MRAGCDRCAALGLKPRSAGGTRRHRRECRSPSSAPPCFASRNAAHTPLQRLAATTTIQLATAIQALNAARHTTADGARVQRRARRRAAGGAPRHDLRPVQHHGPVAPLELRAGPDAGCASVPGGCADRTDALHGQAGAHPQVQGGQGRSAGRGPSRRLHWRAAAANASRCDLGASCRLITQAAWGTCQ